MDRYLDLKGINSQVNEQNNPCLKGIKPSLLYMTQKNFMRHAALFIWYRNKITRERTSKDVM